MADSNGFDKVLEEAPFIPTGGRGTFEDVLEGDPVVDVGYQDPATVRRRVTMSFYTVV